MIATDTRELDPNETYLLAVLSPTTYNAAGVVSAMSTKPPGLSPGTFQVLTIETGDVAGTLASWHVTGTWYGPTKTVPASSGDFSYPAVLHLEAAPGEPLPTSTSTVLWPPDGYDDVPSKTVFRGQHYVFVILVSSTSTEDQAMAGLAGAGWDVRSFSSPPDAIAAELQALYAKGYTAVPEAWIVNAFWMGADQVVLPKALNANVQYTALAIAHPVPFGPPAPHEGPPPQMDDSPWKTVFVAVAVGAVVLGGLYVAKRAMGPRKNPLAWLPGQTNQIVSDGKKGTYSIEKLSGDMFRLRLRHHVALGIFHSVVDAMHAADVYDESSRLVWHEQIAKYR